MVLDWPRENVLERSILRLGEAGQGSLGCVHLSPWTELGYISILSPSMPCHSGVQNAWWTVFQSLPPTAQVGHVSEAALLRLCSLWLLGFCCPLPLIFDEQVDVICVCEHSASLDSGKYEWNLRYAGLIQCHSLDLPCPPGCGVLGDSEFVRR